MYTVKVKKICSKLFSEIVNRSQWSSIAFVIKDLPKTPGKTKIVSFPPKTSVHEFAHAIVLTLSTDFPCGTAHAFRALFALFEFHGYLKNVIDLF